MFAAHTNVAVRSAGGDELREAWTANVGDYPSAMSVSHDGSLLAVATHRGLVFVFDTRDGALHFEIAAHSGGVLSLDWSPRARLLATGGWDGRARLFDERGVEFATLLGPEPSMGHVAWAPDGTKLATASGKVVQIWKASGALAWKTDEHRSAVAGLAWSRGSVELATAWSGGAQVFHLEDPRRTQRFAYEGSPISLAWSPSGSVLACALHERSVRLWRRSTGRDLEISGFPSSPRALSWDARGKLLATGGDTAVNVWTFEDGPKRREPLRLLGHHARCTALAFHPEATWLASGADDTQVFLWGLSSTELPRARGGLEDTITALVWANKGQRLIGADATGIVRGWVVEPAHIF
jgi:WD40 repeat protein